MVLSCLVSCLEKYRLYSSVSRDVFAFYRDLKWHVNNRNDGCIIWGFLFSSSPAVTLGRALRFVPSQLSVTLGRNFLVGPWEAQGWGAPRFLPGRGCTELICHLCWSHLAFVSSYSPVIEYLVSKDWVSCSWGYTTVKALPLQKS